MRTQAHSIVDTEPKSGNVVVRIPTKWFDTYAPVEASPAVTDDRTDADGYRAFDFPPLTPGANKQPPSLKVAALIRIATTCAKTGK